MSTQRIPRILIGAIASNTGKTTIAVGVIAALRRRGLIVQAFKCGPDYIDPSYHERAAGRPCRNLDAWMLTDEQLIDSFQRACLDADIAVIEGVMGLFDGSSWQDGEASSAHIAKLLGAPVILAVDIAGAARSAAAMVLGCQHFDSDLALRGAVLNFAGSENHASGCAEAITSITTVPVFGWLPRDATLGIPERHLGLVLEGEQAETGALIGRIEEAVTARFDLDGLIRVAGTAAPLSLPAPPGPASPRPARSHPPVLAVARDDAFCFYYPENLELLAAAGAAIEFFSPLHGERPSAAAAGVYLGGGYPELHAKALTANTGLWDSLQGFRERNAPIYAECGGFMVLTEALIDAEERRWPMAGLIPGVTRMTGKLAALGYRRATASHANLLVDAGEVLRGHEFRYSTWTCDAPPDSSASAWQVRGTRAAAPPDSGGFATGQLLASYLHIHFAQRADLAQRFVEGLSSR
jgi:cobyrinic acid a,c-diamide synthase